MVEFLTSETQLLAMPAKRMGFFAGSFDPFTHGHLAVVEGVLSGHLDALIVCPHSHNSRKRLSPLEHRVEIARRMLSHAAACRHVLLSDPKFLHGLGTERYAALVQTLLRDGRQVCIVRGDDAVDETYIEALRCLPHIIFYRTGRLTARNDILRGPAVFLPATESTSESSTEARKLISAGGRYHAFDDVHAYILENGLYGSIGGAPDGKKMCRGLE